MSRESIYKRYELINMPQKETSADAYWFIFKDHKMLVEENHNQVDIPFTSNLKSLGISPLRTQYLGKLEGRPCFSAEVTPGTCPPEGMIFKDLRLLYNNLEEDIYLLAGRAVQIVNWDSSHQFCGKCGSPTQTMDDQTAKICPECGFTSHTRLSPAVITAIIKDDKLLMAQHAHGPENRYGLIAGFVEAGETLEEAVKRETAEEVGLEVKNIKYFGSQPWPYPNSLMIGFTAHYASGEIKVDGNEITDAQWFSKDEIPLPPSKMSIASALIEWYKKV